MSKNKKVPNKAKKGKNTRVPSDALVLSKRGSTDNEKLVFSFKYVDPNKWLLSDWQGKELIELIECFKKMENMTWKEIKDHKGLKYSAIHNPPKINHFEISEDITICEVRVCQVKRIHGFRLGKVFHVVWFDKDHSVCVEGKNRKYG